MSADLHLTQSRNKHADVALMLADIRHPTWLDLMYLGCRSGYSAEPRDERKS